MKKLTIKLCTLLFFTGVFFCSCKSLPLYTRHFLECEGAPLALADRPSTDNVNGEFPDTIYIKTLTQTFSFEYDYLLKDGKIYYKQRKAGAGEWKLFKETGLPYSSKAAFEPVKRIVEIAADADVLYAFSDEGKLYRCYTKKITSYTAFEWIDYFGWPRKIQLYQNAAVKNKRCWAVGSSRKDVEYYEDALGNEHNYGPLGVESIPFLCEDGQTIRYCDPACPSDFSHSFKGPLNGNFVAENLSESASTFFLISKDGIMYTRLVDYNTVGSDPMLYDYSYNEVYSHLKGSDPASNTSVWALPNEDWKKQPSLPPGARASTFITIIQTGKGNAERELRVAALNEKGRSGYYYKKINDSDWLFKEAELFIPETAFTEKNAPQPVNILHSYKGAVWRNNYKIENSECSIDNFHFSEGPFTLRFDNENFSVDFYLSEVWTLFLRLQPGLSEEPIRYFGTASFNRDSFSACKNRNLKFLFGNYNKAIHEFYIEAFDTYIKINLKTSKNDWKIYLTKDGSIKEVPEIDRRFIQKNIQLQQRMDNQAPYYEDIEDFYKTEKKINKKEKKTAKHLRQAVGTKKGKKHPVIRLISKKVAIILQYSGEICKINKDFYKENYKLNKKYTKFYKKYSEFLELYPDFDCLQAVKCYVANKEDLCEEEIIYFEELPFYPAFIVHNKKGYILYELDSSFEKLREYFMQERKSVDFDHDKLKL